MGKLLKKKQQELPMRHQRCWKNYNRSLVNRGSITLWIDEDFLKNHPGTESTKGRPKYKKTIIQTGWVLKTLYHLTFRSLEGYFNSLLKMLGSDILSPHYSLFCKRSSDVQKTLNKLSKRRPKEIILDASGLKIFGEGEWKTHKHGRDQKRRWIKLHVSVDPKTGECISTKVTNEKGADCKQVASLLKTTPKSVRKVYGDGAYDTKECRDLFYQKGIQEIIPPRKGAQIRKGVGMRIRNQAISEILGFGRDRDLWKKLKRYGKRSLVETFFSRLKITFGERLVCKKWENQLIETNLKVKILNQMTTA